MRVRTRDEKAYLTIKGKSVNGGMTRYEFEKEITMDEAQHLLHIIAGGIYQFQVFFLNQGINLFGDSVGPYDDRSFTIEYDGLTAEACVKLATADWGADASSGLLALPVPPMIPMVSPDFMEKLISERTGFPSPLR